MSLIWALVYTNQEKGANEEKVMDTDIIALQYQRWLNSKPMFPLEQTVDSSMKELQREAKAYNAKIVSYE